jgi:hypothetical protein
VKPRPPRLPDPIRDELERSGLPWELRVGGSHWKLFIGGVLATVIGHSPTWGGPSHIHNTLGAVRRVIRRIKEVDDAE